MSRQLALDTINLKATPRLAHTEYSLEYHRDYMRRITGLDAEHPDFVERFYEEWGMDFLWTMDEGLNADWGKRGRVTNMGHAEYAADGSDKTDAHISPFNTPEEVWAFDAVEEYGLPDFDEQVAAYEEYTVKSRQNRPNQLMTGGHYRTIVSAAIAAFGWDMLLLGASEPDKMEKVFDSFFRHTLFHMKAWAETSIEAIIQHDDFVWTAGAFMNPEIYRKVIIPRYAELWKPLRAAGKKVLFCSDGNFMEFAEDIVAAGADGLIFEPCNDFEWMAERFGDSTALVGSAVDCRDMTLRDWPVIKESMDRTFKMVEKCRGLIFAVGNHLPPNIPEEALDNYIGYLKANWER